MSEPPQYPSSPQDPHDSSGQAGQPGPGDGPAYTGGYGSVPPPPPPTDMGPTPYSAGGAIGYGWKKFTASPATLLVPILLFIVAMIVISVVLNLIVMGGGSAFTVDADGGFHFDAGAQVKSAIVGIITGIIGQLVMAGIIRGGLEVTDGRKPAIGELFEGWDKVQVLIAALIMSVLSTIGFMLCLLPGIVFSFLAQFTLYFIVARGASATQAIGDSVKFVIAHFGEIFVFSLLAFLVSLLGAILCGVGLLVAFPVVIVAQAYTFRMLHQEPVSPAV